VIDITTLESLHRRLARREDMRLKQRVSHAGGRIRWMWM
jgi:hypothetical protein